MVFMKIAISSVRPENAKLNLNTEIPDWNFNRVRALAHAEWNRRLSTIEIQSDTTADKTFFYTELFHTFFQPNVFSDVNGEYLGFDQKIKAGTSDFTQYTSFSGWDIYRTWVPLLSLIAPHEVSQMMQSLVNDAEQCGGALPRWVVDNYETGVMLSGSATPIISGAYAFGARDFDLQGAFRAMDMTESQPGAHCQSVEEHQYLSDYLQRGYIAWSNHDEGDWAGRESDTGTLELAVGDHALSSFARALGLGERADFYAKLSENWRSILNTESGWFQPRLSDGTWMPGFNPRTAWDDTGIERGFTEGNAYHYGWMVPQNLAGLFQALGGDQKVIERLDTFFTELNSGVVTSSYDTAAGSPYSWIGNEPSFDVPFEYNWAHAPWKTQKLVHRMIGEVFRVAMPGADDLGALSAWAVWASLGLYPEIPGEPGLAISSPYFSKITIHTGAGGTIVLDAGNSSGDYIQNLKVNGISSQRAWFDLPKDFASQTKLEFQLGDTPSSWGSAVGDEPPSPGLK
jgi:predicted alpha-1,2-mannosidase